MLALDGKVALITGAARGQGRAIAVLFAAQGANVIAVDICESIGDLSYPSARIEDLQETVRLIESTGGNIVARVADVRSLEELRAAVADGVTAFGRLDIVVANAGISDWGRVWELSDRQWTDMININLNGVWNTMRVSIPDMIQGSEGGSIIITSSIAGIKPLPGQAHYSAAKFGLVGLMKSSALELAEYGIRVNTVHPYCVNTPMVEDPRFGEMLQAHPNFVSCFPQSRLPSLPIAEPIDLANAALFLASEVSRGITGIQLPVDMGTGLV